MTEPLKEQSRMIAKELSWKPTEREELIEIISLKLSQMIVDDKPDRLGYTKSMILADAILEWHKKCLKLPKRKKHKRDCSEYMGGCKCGGGDFNEALDQVEKMNKED